MVLVVRVTSGFMDKKFKNPIGGADRPMHTTLGVGLGLIG